MKITEIQKEYSKARGQAEQFAPIFRQYQKLAANVVDRRNGIKTLKATFTQLAQSKLLRKSGWH